MYSRRKVRLIDPDLPPLNVLLSGNSYAVDEHVLPGYKYEISNTGYLALILTLAGSSRYIINGQFLEITKGSLLALPPGIEFSEVIGNPAGCHNTYLMLEGPMARSLSGKVISERPFVYWPEAPTRLAGHLSRTVMDILGGAATRSWQIAANLCFLGALLTEGEQDPAHLSLPERVRRMIVNQPGELWNVAALATSLGMSESSFAHSFSRIAGVAPANFVRKVRCQLARQALHEGLSVSDVSDRLGFANPYHFSRVFKKVYGNPPSRYIGRSEGLHRIS